MTIEAVLFDFGRVLGNFDKKKAWTRLSFASCFSPEVIGEIIAAQNLEKMLESGIMSPTAFANELLYHTMCDLTVPHVMRVWGDIFTPNTAIEPYIHRIMTYGLTVGVLSNTNSIHLEYILELPLMMKLRKEGVPFILSHEVKAMKPGRRIYEIALKRLKSKGRETLFIDDLEENVVAARKAGLHAEQYDCTKNTSRVLDEIFSAYNLP